MNGLQVSYPRMFSMEGKIAVVTGACGLLGRHHCEALAEAGARVVVADMDIEAGEDIASGLETESIALVIDVTRPESVRSFHERVTEQFGSVDVLINNAAINDKFESPDSALEESQFENYALESWQRMMQVNVTGTFLCCQIIGADMVRRRRGSIINIASTYGLVAPDQSLYVDHEGRQRFYKSAAYPTTKGAVVAFTRFLAAYWGSSGVRVNCLSPGGVENRQDEFFVQKYSARTPLGRMASPGDYRGAVVFLASDASAYMTGANLVVDGGWTVW